MSRQENQKIKGRMAYFIDHKSLPTENALWDIKKDIKVERPDGTIHDVVLTPEARFIYFRLTKSVNWDEEKTTPVTWSIRNFANRLGWGVNKLQKNLDLLEFIGLIEVKRTPGEKNLYTVKSLRTSFIMYDRKDETGEYVHKEIRYYIKAMNEKREDFMKDIDPFFYTIIQTLNVNEDDLTTEEKRELKRIIDESDELDKPGLLSNAIHLKTQKNSLQSFLNLAKSQKEKKGHSEYKRRVPFYNWLEE